MMVSQLKTRYYILEQICLSTQASMGQIACLFGGGALHFFYATRQSIYPAF